jgi:hypothetical protein
MSKHITTSRRKFFPCLIAGVLLATTLAVRATTYMSVEPIPSRDVVGQDALVKILSVGYPNLEQWSNRLLNECGIVQDVIDVLASHGAISTVHPGNTSFRVAAGGFEGNTNPSFVFTVQDSGLDAVSEADVNVLDNALGYVLNQSGTAHFSPDNPKAYFFSLDYAVVTFDALTGVEAKGFFDFLGTIDPALWSGRFAGFTQIDFQESPTDNSMLFLKPATSKQRFIAGLSAAAAAETSPDGTYVTLNNNGEPTTAKAGIAFPGNDWIAFPGGDQYLLQLGEPSPELLSQLATLRQLHLQAVDSLLSAIDKGAVRVYLDHQFKCPAE